MVLKGGWKANLVLGTLSLVIFFSITEATLYFMGFNYSQFPRFMNITTVDNYIDWQSSNFTVQHFVPHKKRMWAAMPEKGIVNELGFIGKKISLDRVPEKNRILFLGDSCTAGKDYYPEKTIRILNAQSGINAEPLIAATGGYSTFQGLDVLEESVKYKPDILISYFGWNDHWQALGGLPDHEFKTMSDFQLNIHKFSSKLRTYQLLHYMIYPPHKYLGKDSLPAKTRPIDMLRFLRVPSEQFMSNIREMIKISEENNIQAYFIAAPMGPHIKDRESILLPREFIIPIHLHYISLLKKVVAEYPNAHIIDFNNIVFDRSLMMTDGVHLTDKGHEVVAGEIVKILLEKSRLQN